MSMEPVRRRVLVALAAAGVVCANGRALAAPPRVDGAPVRFLPMTRTGCAGAFLVVGPLAGRSESVERGRRLYEGAREGDALPGVDAAAGGAPRGATSWRLLVAKPWNLGAAFGDYGDRGFLYAQVDLPLDPQEPRYLVYKSAADVWVRVGGRAGALHEATARAYELGQVKLDTGEGSVTLLLRVELAGSPAGVAVLYGKATSARRISARPTELRLSDSTPQRLARLFAESLAVRLYPVLAREGEGLSAELSRERACPDVPAMLGGALSVEFVGGPAGALRLADGPAAAVTELPDLTKPSLASARYIVSENAPGRHTVEAVISRDALPLARVKATGLVAEGIERLASRLEEDAGKLLGKKGVPQNAVAYALLQAEKARLAFADGGGPRDPAAFGRDLLAAERALREAARGRDFQDGLTGFMERAYYAEADDSAQPYLAYVPAGVKPAPGGRRWPTVVYLHGYVPSYDKHAWVGEDRNFNAVMEAEGVILAVPFARSNTDFLNVGEDDVLRVMEEMKREYPVDTDRVYIYGYSMGGSGVWTMLAHYPDVFAGAVVLAGRSDYYLWHGVPRERFPEWKRFMIDCDNPIGQARNIRHVPVRVYHGDKDWLVKPEQSSVMVARLKELGGTAELHWVRGGTHWSLYEAVMWKRDPVAWLKRHSRVAPLGDHPPSELFFRAYHPRFARGWGVRVMASRQETAPVEILLKPGGGRLVVEAKNAAGLAASGPLAGFADRIDVRDKDGGNYVTSVSAQGLAAVAEGFEQSPVKCKRGCTCGPVKEAFRSPFAVVYGTAGDADENAGLRRKADRFVKEWRDFAKGRPPLYADAEVTPEVARARNLILFGEPETNAVLRRIAAKLPVKWSRDSAEIAGASCPLTNPETGGERGLIFCHPNPEAPCRLVVVMSGLYWGSSLPINHKWDWVPDFIVFEDKVDPLDRMDPVNKAVVAGFFGRDWRFEPDKTFKTEP